MSEATTPQDIKQQIATEAEKRYPFIWPKNKHGEEIVQRVGQNAPGIAKAKRIQNIFKAGAEFGYSLQLKEKDEQIRLLQMQVDHLDEGCNQRDKRIAELEQMIEAAKSAFKEIYSGTPFPLSIAQNALKLINNQSK